MIRLTNSIRDQTSEFIETIGRSTIPLNINNINDFVDFYQNIAVSKGPLFDSSMAFHNSSRWSFFSLLPKLNITKISESNLILTIANQKTIIHECFLDQLNDFPFKSLKDYPALKDYPFIGGFMGYISYENNFENIKTKNNQSHSFPLYQFLFFTNVFLFDHIEQKAILISDGDSLIKEIYDQWMQNKNNKKIPINENKITMKATISKEKYLSKIEEIFEHIRKGDIYQANFTHQFSSELNGDAFTIYQSLRKKNPAPFACFYPINEKQFILCSSPERLFQVQNGTITSSPIKGTIRRDADHFIDEKLKKDLLNSVKDAAELAMIVDLIRNDIGRISEYGSVKVLAFKKLESFQKVHHLIGTITGKLKPDVTVKNIFEALFPGGSITGAPKIRSMEILNTLEEKPRGPYTGSVGYIDIRGNMDFNIMIRTILIDHETISLQVGGGIVIDSNPYCEYEETLHKAEAIFDAL